MNLSKPVFLASSSDEASSQKKILEDKFGKNDFDKADVIVVLGGDGFMLEAIKSHMNEKLPIFGLNYGSVGFLMNSSNQNDLINRINQSQSIKISPLMMKALSVDGSIHEAIAINEVSLLRETHQASKIKISVDGKIRLKTIFGSSTRGGAAAFIQLARLLKDGEVVGITPDGPKGPRMRANSGVVSLAKVAGAPIVPLTFSSSFSHVFGSWDRFVLPLPFSL